MIAPNYPAAHSMDTTWYAVDAAGRVAAFQSGEDGHVPLGATDADFVFDLWRLWDPENNLRRTADLAAALGLFFYSYAGHGYVGAGLYQRESAPVMPLHVAQLPPAMRVQCSQLRFEDLDFRQVTVVQPLEQFPCRSWYANPCPMYLAVDGVTLRLVPGQEHRYWEIYSAYSGDAPGQFRFEGIERSPDRVTVRTIPGDPKAFWDFFARLQRERPAEAARYYFELNADAP